MTNNKEKRYDNIKWAVTFAVVFVLVISTVLVSLQVFTDIKPFDVFKNAGENETAAYSIVTDENGNELEEGTVYSMPAVLNFTSNALALADGNTITATISATVYPSTAVNKAVDWEVKWLDADATGTVTDYVTVTPKSDGSTTATVTCKKAFSSDIQIIVTTRESGFQAFCVVKYVGMPTELNFSSNYSTASYCVGTTYLLGVGNNTITVQADNNFHDVSSSYSNYEITSITGHGYIVVGDATMSATDGVQFTDTANFKTLSVDSLKNSFISCSISGSTITVNFLKSFESYYESCQQEWLGHWSYKGKFFATSAQLYEIGSTDYEPDGVDFDDFCGYAIRVTEETSGLSKVMYVTLSSTAVTGVSLGTSEITF